MKLSGLLRSAQQLLLPARCSACDCPIDAEHPTPLCLSCSESLAALMQQSYCPRCGRNAGPYAADKSGCAECRGKPIRFDGIVRIGQYDDPLRKMILHAKYHQESHLAKVLGRILSRQVLTAEWADAIYAIVPVPLFWRRRWSRGYNQARLIARALRRDFRRPLAPRSLLRVRHTPQQVGLPTTKRWANVRGAFDVRKADGRLDNRSILLVDDVMTSGATVSECARTLKRAGAKAVYIAVAAVAGTS